MTDEYPYDDMFSLQPLVDRVTVEKRVFDILQKNNLDLMEKLEIAKEALRFYADETHYQKECVDSKVGAIEEVIIDNGRIAKEALKEIET